MLGRPSHARFAARQATWQVDALQARHVLGFDDGAHGQRRGHARLEHAARREETLRRPPSA